MEADEVTYNLHVILRYEIEKGLFGGKIRTRDLPAVWNRKMRELLGIVPRRESEGVLQDIHWAGGLFGYFPTYSLGNLYSAQLFEKARKDIRGLDGKIARGDLKPLREWLVRLHHELNVTTVFVTHDQEEAMEVSNRIVIFSRGRLEQIGTPREVYEQPSNEFVARFIGVMKAIAERSRTEPDAVRAAPSTTPVGRLDEATAARQPDLRWSFPGDDRTEPGSSA